MPSRTDRRADRQTGDGAPTISRTRLPFHSHICAIVSWLKFLPYSRASSHGRKYSLSNPSANSRRHTRIFRHPEAHSGPLLLLLLLLSRPRLHPTRSSVKRPLRWRKKWKGLRTRVNSCCVSPCSFMFYYVIVISNHVTVGFTDGLSHSRGSHGWPHSRPNHHRPRAIGAYPVVTRLVKPGAREPFITGVTSFTTWGLYYGLFFISNCSILWLHSPLVVCNGSWLLVLSEEEGDRWDIKTGDEESSLLATLLHTLS